MEKESILLVQPRTSLLERGKSSPAMPLSLLYVAVHLAEKYHVDIYDERLDPSLDLFLERYRADPPILIGITAVTGRQVGYASQLASKFHSRLKAPIVWGGKHATLFPKELLEGKIADFVIRGEGEISFRDLTHAVVGKMDTAGIPGVALSYNGNIQSTSIATTIDMEGIPPLPYSILHHGYLFKKKGIPTSLLESSRGCPYRCAYCYHSIGQKSHWRGAGPEWVCMQLKALRASRPETGHIDFVDDNFFVSKQRAMEIAAIIVDETAFTFTSNGGRVRDLLRYSAEELKELRKCGLDRIDLGVETGSQAVMDLIDKNDSLAEVHQVCGALTRAGISPWINIMVGFPGEKPEDLRSTIDLVGRLTASHSPLFISPIYSFTPYPGTRLFAKARDAGYPLPTMDQLQNAQWNQPQSPWLSRKEQALLARLYFYSLFIDKKILLYREEWLIRIALTIIGPIARFRIRKMWFSFPLLKWIHDAIAGDNY